MYLDFKVTVWERVYIPEEIKEEVIEALHTGQVQTSNDAFCIFLDKGVYFEGTIEETEEQMTPEKNGGYSTIEFLDDDGEEPIFKNGK